MKSLGQIAYEAFKDSIKGSGAELVPPLHDWDVLFDETRAAWEASADAITAALLKKPAEFAV